MYSRPLRRGPEVLFNLRSHPHTVWDFRASKVFILALIIHNNPFNTLRHERCITKEKEPLTAGAEPVGCKIRSNSRPQGKTQPRSIKTRSAGVPVHRLDFNSSWFQGAGLKMEQLLCNVLLKSERRSQSRAVTGGENNKLLNILFNFPLQRSDCEPNQTWKKKKGLLPRFFSPNAQTAGGESEMDWGFLGTTRRGKPFWEHDSKQAGKSGENDLNWILSKTHGVVPDCTSQA